MKPLILALTLLISSPTAFANTFLASKAATLAMMGNLQISSDSIPQVDFQEVISTKTSDRITLTLVYPGLPATRIFMSGPTGFLQKTDRSLPTLFLIAGFFTGAYNSLLLGEMTGEMAGEVANMVVVSFDYPYKPEAISQDPAKLLQTFRLTPGLLALSLKWLSQQSWMNPQQSLAMGVSLGGLFLPAGLQIAQEMNAAPARTVFAFTGANIKAILANIFTPHIPQPALEGLLITIPTVNALSDPKLHLPYLKGSFLVIHADQDQIIPRSTTEELLNLLPAAKTQVVLPGHHIDYDHNLQIQQTKEAIFKWLQNHFSATAENKQSL